MKKVSKIEWRVLSALLMLLFEAGCSSPHTVHSELSDYAFLERGQIRKSFQRINPSDGIDRSEACLLSSVYFDRYEGLCGFAKLESQTSRNWIFGTAIGYSGVPGPEIKVNKHTGVIRHKGHRSLGPPWKELSDYLEMISR